MISMSWWQLPDDPIIVALQDFPWRLFRCLPASRYPSGVIVENIGNEFHQRRLGPATRIMQVLGELPATPTNSYTEG